MSSHRLGPLDVGARCGYPSRCIHELFEEQVTRTPDSTAVTCDGEHLTYAELNARANQVASDLRSRGAGVESLVGICIEPSLEAAFGVLAILKAGAAYVSLPPVLPAARLATTIAASRMTLALTTSACRSLIESDAIACLCIDRHPMGDLAPDPQTGVTLDHAALIRYTSGSTGSPKGAIVTHRSLVSRIHSASFIEAEPGDVCGVNTTFNLGPRLLHPWVRGARVVIIGDEPFRDPARLVRLVADNAISSMSILPTLLRKVLELDPDLVGLLKTMRAIVVGGEALPPDLAARFFAMLPNVLLVNAYGSTELAGYSTIHVLTPSTRDCDSIGQAVANTRVYLLDERLVAVQPGVIGEIYVGSAHLARGYLHRPDLTAECFLPDPFALEPGSRMCRTGDLGRRTDGAIEFMGRADDQVKIRGMRVELREVEAALLASDHVREVAVVYEGPSQRPSEDLHHPRLIAYVVGGEGLRLMDLRASVRSRLPEHMVPSVFAPIDQLPRLPNGKLDRQALPPPNAARPALDTPYVPPRNTLEATLSELWVQALGLDDVGVHDHFLEVGGDSVAAMTIVSGIRRRVGADVPVASIFLHPTIAGFAQHVLSDRGSRLPTPTVPAQPHASTEWA